MNTKTLIISIIFLATLAFIIWGGHQAHTLGVLPYLLLLACPFMHIFMHSGHHGHHHEHKNISKNEPPTKR